MGGIHGILLVDKPPGWTSHDVVARMRGVTGQRKIGHTGTLDPLATGLLVLCLGDATRLVEYMIGHDKRYEGELRLGQTTTTDDAEGTIVFDRAVPPLSDAELGAVARRFIGDILQRPPDFSAVKVAGQRAYAAARRGNALELAERPVSVHTLQLVRLEGPRLRIVVQCGSGTYIRSLARDIGEVLGCGAHLTALRRVSAGRFRVSDAYTIEEVAALAAAGQLPDCLWPADSGIEGARAAIVTTAHGREFAQGSSLQPAGAALGSPPPVRVYDAAGSFLGVGEIVDGGALRARKVFAGQ